MDCIFCKIINGEIPCYKVYENDDVLAFLDINPDSDGHTRVIPKKHFKDISDIDEDSLKNVMKGVRKVKEILESKLNIDGITLIQNNGDVQEVKHLHFHLKPYYKEKKLTSVDAVYKKIEE